MKEEVNKTLDIAKDQFDTVLIIGLREDNTIDVVTSNSNYAVGQYLLNRASFELLIHEKANLGKKENV